MAALPLQDCISETTEVKINYYILRAQFGNGAEQTAPNGLNNRETVWTITYNNLNQANAETVLSFLHGLNGSTPFEATLPGDTVAKTWRINPDSLSVRYVARSNITGENYRTVSFSARTRG
jgi:phage-related protein